MRLYGLIGNPLTHSFSKKYFSEKFMQEGITGCRYELFPLTSIDQLPGLLTSNPELCGLNVTIPYKEQVLKYVTGRDPVVNDIQAANCLHIEGGRIVAYNTDVTGFEKSLLAGWQHDHHKALVLGTGGAAKAVIYVLRKLGVAVNTVSRKKTAGTIAYEAVTPAVMHEHTLVINTTPLGTYPEIDGLPALPYEAVTSRHYFFDLVYNPERTRFLGLAAQHGAAIRNGADMLAIQAEESWKIWTGLSK